MNFRVLFLILLAFEISMLEATKKIRVSKNKDSCSTGQVIHSWGSGKLLGHEGAYRYFATVDGVGDRWCVLPTGQIQNIPSGRYAYVYFELLQQGNLIQLVYLDLNSYDGGDAAKWIVQKESNGYSTIRSKMNPNYVIGVTSDQLGAELQVFSSSLMQYWSFV